MPNSSLALKNISKNYMQGNKNLKIIDGISINIESGDFLAITGPSGSGKTTLLNIMGLLDISDKGSIILNNTDITNIGSEKKNNLRKNYYGFIYQNFNLLENFNV